LVVGDSAEAGVSQQDYRSFTGPSGPGRASGPGVLRVSCPVDDRCSVVEVGSSRRLWSCCPLSRRCRVSSLYRSRAIVLDETVKVTARSWWRVPVGGEVWWWCSGVPEFFCRWGSGEIPVGLSDPDAVPLSSGTIPSWRASWEASIYFTPSRGKP
jgi:hypothetical protein